MKKRYNYFDDEPEELEQKNPKKINLNIDFVKIAYTIKYHIEDLIHGNTLKEFRAVRELPNLRSLLLKLLAFVLFLIFILIFILSFSHSINSQSKKNNQYYADAGKVCTEYISKYGNGKWEPLDSKTYGDSVVRLTGLCYARQMDFNNDSKDELMLCYNDGTDYTLEVWGYVDKEFKKIYSEPANSTEDVKDGSWIAFYYKSKRYYICKSSPSSPEKVDLYTLKGDKFKKSSSCDYDYKDDIYSIKGTINAEDFETIRLSVIKSGRADRIIDTVTNNISQFNTVSLAEINSKLTDAQLKAAAYYEVVDSRNEKYGKAKLKKSEGKSYIEGLAYVGLVDFNGDENDELLLVYRKMLRESATNAYTGEKIIIENPTYCIEVYSWNGTIAKKIFSKENISNYLDNDTINYIMLKQGKSSISICQNTYKYTNSYSYTATSKIYRLKGESFNPTFSARIENSYGYMSYYLDGEYSYRSQFEEEGYKVPKFMNNDGKYDESKYKLIYFSGKNESELGSIIDDTVKTIKKLNKSYSPND